MQSMQNTFDCVKNAWVVAHELSEWICGDCGNGGLGDELNVGEDGEPECPWCASERVRMRHEEPDLPDAAEAPNPTEIKAENEQLRKWQYQVADGLGFLNHPEGQSGYEVATPEVILRGERTFDSSRFNLLLKFAKDQADADCAYGDNCPTFGSRHGQCYGCAAREVLSEIGVTYHDPVTACVHDEKNKCDDCNDCGGVIRSSDEKSEWVCGRCGEEVDSSHVTFEETHDGCGGDCDVCDRDEGRVEPVLRIIIGPGGPGPTAGRFIEVEDATGRSINAGTWTQRPDNTWALTISVIAVAQALAAERKAARL
jgi:ribosomal protein S27AE